MYIITELQSGRSPRIGSIQDVLSDLASYSSTDGNHERAFLWCDAASHHLVTARYSCAVHGLFGHRIPLLVPSTSVFYIAWPGDRRAVALHGRRRP